MTTFYVLKNGEPVEATFEEWSKFLASRDKILFYDHVSGIAVSTIFLGFESAEGDFYETAIHAPYQTEPWLFRAAHMQEADKFHNQAKEVAQKVADGVCPMNEECLSLLGAPLGQFHCPFCGEMILAGVDTAPLCPIVNKGAEDGNED